MRTKSVLIVAFATCGWTLLAQRPDPLPALVSRVDRLQARLQGIESVRAIKRLQYAYGHYTELGLWNDFADLFAENAATNYQQGAQGREGVRKLFLEQVGQGRLGLADGRIYPHILFQPVIHLGPDGKTAKGRWRILAMLGGMGGNATWYSGVYENEYILDNGSWKISLLRSEPKATAGYTATGWKDSGVRLPLHYTSDSVASPVPDLPVSNSGAASLPELSGRVNDLAQRAARLNAQGEVTNLLDAYVDAIDRKQWSQAADLFARKGTLELGLQGVYAGKASIQRALAQSKAAFEDHVYLQTLVSVAPNGQTANARGVEYIFSNNGGAELTEGIFENTFVKENSAWKIRSVHFYPRMIVDASQGWAKSAKPAPGPSKELPPDRPPTVTYEIYPKFSVAPFHFENPATGKPPQYPAGVPAFVKATAAAPANGPAIRAASDLAARVTELEHAIERAATYDIAENLLSAYGYRQDDTPSANGGTIFTNQVLQPILDIAADGKSVKVRAHRLDLGGTSGAAGYWSAGSIEAQMVSGQGGWKFQAARSPSIWVAPYPGGWAQLK